MITGNLPVQASTLGQPNIAGSFRVHLVARTMACCINGNVTLGCLSTMQIHCATSKEPFVDIGSLRPGARARAAGLVLNVVN